MPGCGRAPVVVESSDLQGKNMLPQQTALRSVLPRIEITSKTNNVCSIVYTVVLTV